MTQLRVTLPEHSYTVTVGRGLLRQAHTFMDLSRRVFILTDSGVPSQYAETIRACAACATVYTVPQGEGSKSLRVLGEVLESMLAFEMTRRDCVVAVGGGVVGDLGGFAAATYMRGIDFYNVPTTLLSQVDSSIGGKTAVNLGVVKNIVGAFHQPKAVLVDPDTLRTLPARQMASGYAEAIKMALAFDKELFSLFECADFDDDTLTQAIARSIDIKRRVVEQDEKETGLRRALNLGHTLGHGIEAAEGLGGLYHGECVALGMLPMCSPDVKHRLLPVLARFGLQTDYKYDIDYALSFLKHDKKSQGDGVVSVVLVDEVGSFRMERMPFAALETMIKERVKP